MGKKIERVFRGRRLSAEEIARDQDVRSQVQAEFPPATSTGNAPGVLSDALKSAMSASDQPLHEIAQKAGVSPIVLSRFLSGERDIRMATADKLASVLGLAIAPIS